MTAPAALAAPPAAIAVPAATAAPAIATLPAVSDGPPVIIDAASAGAAQDKKASNTPTATKDIMAVKAFSGVRVKPLPYALSVSGMIDTMQDSTINLTP